MSCVLRIRFSLCSDTIRSFDVKGMDAFSLLVMEYWDLGPRLILGDRFP